VEDVWPLFLVTTGATLTPTVRTMDGATTAMTPVTAEVLVWAMPWPQLIVLLGIALVILAIAWGRIRSRRKVAALVAEAKEQGRREAAEREEASPAPVRQDAGER
jgi:type VI protein secretion system component VasK